MSPLRRARGILTALTAALELASFALGVSGSVALPQIAREARAMCEGLPDYAALGAALPVDARVMVVVDAGEERAAERFVCARLALAPRRVDARRHGEPLPAPAEAAALLFDLGTGAGPRLEVLP